MAKKQEFKYSCDNKECDHFSFVHFSLCPICKNGFGEKEEIKNESMISKTIDKSSKKNSEFLNKEYIKNENLTRLSSVENSSKVEKRIQTSYPELDKLFGGIQNNYGIMPDSLTIISGEPGIGKSTLLLKIQDHIETLGYKTAYISAEENVTQINERAKRLNVKNDLCVVNENNLLQIITDFEDFDVLFIDSIQTMFMEGGGELGGVSQLKTAAMVLMKYAKQQKKTIILVGQVTKEDTMAGPRMLEHMVDTVLFFSEYDDQGIYRYVRSGKNRFGKNGEISIFKMESNGLTEIQNPSLLFINKDTKKIGAANSIILDGHKPIFIETQALLVSVNSEKTITQSIGYDLKRIFQISAILQKYLKKNVYQKNTFIATTGGIKINSTHTDLSIASAILSSLEDVSINDMIFIGEIGLTGEIIKAPNEELLIEQSKKYGFDKIISNSTGYKHIKEIEKFFSKK
jgi:DNA repair protein RadA/Sms